MSWILHLPGADLQFEDEPVYSDAKRGWQTASQLVLDPDRRGTVEQGSLPPPPPPAPPAWEWFIDIGPFFDRFGAAKMAVLTSSSPVVKALLQDIMVRKWVDLKRADVAAGLDAIIAVGVAGVDAALKSYILTTPVTDEENMALRRLFF